MSNATDLEGSTQRAPSPVVIDLLGMMAYGELLAFDRMAADARLAPDLPRRAELCEIAADEIGNYRRIVTQLARLHADPVAAMRPFVPALTGYHEQTEPKDWLEALTKVYVGDGLADDFVREVAGLLPSTERSWVLDVVRGSRPAHFAVAEIRAVVAADPAVASRLSMWGRRLVGEGITQAQRLAAERTALIETIVGSGERAGLPDMFVRLTAAHTRRMSAAGLNN